MNIRPIKTKRDHAHAPKRVEELWNAKPNTPEGDELEVLSTLIEVYEREHYPVEAPDPIEALKFRLEVSFLNHIHHLKGIRECLKDTLLLY